MAESLFPQLKQILFSKKHLRSSKKDLYNRCDYQKRYELKGYCKGSRWKGSELFRTGDGGVLIQNWNQGIEGIVWKK